MIQSELDSTRVGVFILVVGGVHYVCSAFNMTMAVNQIPVASCVVGCGRQIAGGSTDDNSAENLYAWMQAQEAKGSDSLVPCQVYEVIDTHRYIVFKGDIVGASLVYKTGGSTIRAVRFELMYSACRLKSQPLTASKNVCGSHVVNTLLAGNTDNLSDKEALMKSGMIAEGVLSSKSIISKIQNRVKDKDIATRIACICDAYAVLTSYTFDLIIPTTARIGDILHIKKYIRSKYGLDKQRLQLANENITDTKFSEIMCDWLKQGLGSGSIYDAIIRMLVSSEFMLSIIPRFSDGMMEIKPSSAWGTDNKINQIPLSSVSSINSAFHPLDHINDPEVFAVNFTDALDMRGNKTDGGTGTGLLIGAYATNPEAAKWVKLRFMEKNSEAEKQRLLDSTTYYKWRMYPAPTWLSDAFTLSAKSTGVSDSVLQLQAIKDQKLCDNIKDRNTERTQADQQNRNLGESIADAVAQALYTMLYKQTATAELMLLPDIRFGIHQEKYGFVLEEQLGELIDITYADKTDAAGNSNKPLSIRGMVSAINFSYSAGRSASCSYQLTLSRVRLRDEKEPKLVCPLYAKITEK